MNIYSYIILITLVIDFALGAIADYLNLKSFKTSPPPELKDIYTDEKYKQSREYYITRTKFGYISEILELVLFLSFWFFAGFEIIDVYLRSQIQSEILRGLAFFGLAGIVNFIIDLPFSIYSTFVIEEKFGFNKTDAKTFILDIVKGAGLSVVIGAPIGALILYLLIYLGPLAWLYGWIASIVLSLALQYIAPNWIMPLFNKFTPLPDGELKTKIMDYAQKVKFPLTNLFVMDGSKRSGKGNAFFTGFGKNKRIALFDTLIEKHSTKELVGVLAHEIGHFKKKHILKGTITGMLQTGAIFYLLSLFLNDKALFSAFYVTTPSVYLGLVFFGSLYGSIALILSFVFNMFSRKHEYEADAYAVKTTGDAKSFVNALKKLSVDNLSNPAPHKFYVAMHYSHPPLFDRIKAIENIKVE